jgi:hypothetical protein
VAKEVERSAFLRSLSLRSGSPQAGYPFELPAITTMGTLRFGEVTIFVGQNGTGKSTLIEALAVAAGLNAEGGSNNLRFETMATHSDLADHLALQWIRRPRWGWFLRAETFYGMATHIAQDTGQYGIATMFPNLHARSHGESFLELIESRFGGPTRDSRRDGRSPRPAPCLLPCVGGRTRAFRARRHPPRSRTASGAQQCDRCVPACRQHRPVDGRR